MLDNYESHIYSLRFLGYSFLNCSFSVVSHVLETWKLLFKDTQQENNLKKTKDSDSHYLYYRLRLYSKLNGTLTFKYVFNCVINLLLSLILLLVHI